MVKITNKNNFTEIKIELNHNLSKTTIGDYEISLNMWVDQNCQSPVNIDVKYSDSIYKIPTSIIMTFSDYEEAVLFKLSRFWKETVKT